MNVKNQSWIIISLIGLGLQAQAATNCAEVTEIPAAECEILLELYNSTNGEQWERHLGWNVTNTPCSWTGIICGDGQITKLSLQRNQLSGLIPAALGNFTHLEWLQLHRNQLSGSIPAELGNLTTLERLYLYSNELTGSIPAELGNLTSLKRLYLYSNELTGSIPATLGNLSHLEALWLHLNQLSGSIPPSLGNLSHLNLLDLSSNQLCGEIPVSLMNLDNLSSLELRENHFTASNPELLAWVENLNPLWDTSQTACPTIDETFVQIASVKEHYSSEEHFQAQLTENLSEGYDLYAAVMMPDGNFFALTNTNEFAALNFVAKWGGQRTPATPVILLDLILPNDLPTGEYCLYGILSPQGKAIFETVDSWVWTRQCFGLNN